MVRKLNMGKSFRGEIGGPETLSQRVGVYLVTLPLSSDMSVPVSCRLQGRITMAPMIIGAFLKSLSNFILDNSQLRRTIQFKDIPLLI